MAMGCIMYYFLTTRTRQVHRKNRLRLDEVSWTAELARKFLLSLRRFLFSVVALSTLPVDSRECFVRSFDDDGCGRPCSNSYVREA